MARDPKGIYRRAREGGADTVPGLQATYEVPEKADVVLQGDREVPADAAGRVIAKLIEMKYV
jgi:adenylylsulfate kinase-like enzyme